MSEGCGFIKDNSCNIRLGEMQGISLKLDDGTSSLPLSVYLSLCVHVCEIEIEIKQVIWPAVMESGERCTCLNDQSYNFLSYLCEFWR